MNSGRGSNHSSKYPSETSELSKNYSKYPNLPFKIPKVRPPEFKPCTEKKTCHIEFHFELFGLRFSWAWAHYERVGWIHIHHLLSFSVGNWKVTWNFRLIWLLSALRSAGCIVELTENSGVFLFPKKTDDVLVERLGFRRSIGTGLLSSIPSQNFKNAVFSDSKKNLDLEIPSKKFPKSQIIWTFRKVCSLATFFISSWILSSELRKLPSRI